MDPEAGSDPLPADLQRVLNWLDMPVPVRQFEFDVALVEATLSARLLEALGSVPQGSTDLTRADLDEFRTYFEPCLLSLVEATSKTKTKEVGGFAFTLCRVLGSQVGIEAEQLDTLCPEFLEALVGIHYRLDEATLQRFRSAAR